jgi:uncharacterized protein YegL
MSTSPQPQATLITEIAFILDRSGSMESVRKAAIDGFNEFLRDQQASPGQARLTLVLFDDRIEIPIECMPVSEIQPLTRDGFVPRGSTALLDAIGGTIDQLVSRIKATPEENRPGHVAVAIMTDGEENSSRRFTWHAVSERIAHQTEKYGWDFLFLGAGPDAIATAGRMSIGAHSSANYMSDDLGQAAASKSLSRKISSSRSMKAGDATPEQVEDFAAPLADILHDEDSKRREP